ncbi:MAG TPA: multidrug MFS transporter [Ignavibacteria bacterium]|nr:multidrug MFS transporter [Ignavibacteria bacterium]
MIFVTVGNSSFQFDRLIQSVDNLISQNIIKGKVIMQIGNSKYLPHNAEYFRYCSGSKLTNYITESTLIICHGGIGTIFACLKKNKKVIAIARLPQRGEHSNEHQIEIINQLVKEGQILGSTASNSEDLLALYKKSTLDGCFNGKIKSNTSFQIIQIINDFLAG